MATSRSVKVILAAQVNAFKADMAAAGKAASDAAQKTETAWDKSSTGAGKAMASIGKYEQELTTAGTAMAGFGAVVTGALGLTAKAAMDWESSWTGVLKTVDGTPAQLAKVEQGLRDLSKELPASHAEIAAVAEAAGQLGIETDNVVGFTKTMINMGESTNISAEEAATSLARLSNIMGTSQDDFDKMGASIVGLGNNFATTESEIVNMSLRIAAVGKQSGMTEGEVFGLATALSSVGIEAEAGGTAISSVMKKITSAVGEGGEGLDEFARISGVSSSEFAAAWEEDAAGALSMFVTGLHEADQSGENVNSTLSELGITGIRESDSLLRLAGASDVLTDALKQGNEEYEKGTALAEEAAKRYETAESKIKIAGNSLKDTAIAIGDTFLPAIAGVAEGAADIVSAIGDIPEPVLKAGGAIAGIAGAAALGIGGIMLIIPKLAETATAFETLRTAAGNSNSSMGKVSKAAGRMSGAIAGISKAAVGITAVVVAFQALDSAMDKVTSDQIPGLEKINAELITLAKGGGVLSDAFGGGNAFTDWLGGSQAVNDMADALEVVGRHAEGSTTGLAKFREAITPGRQELEKATDGINAYDEGLASLTSSGQTELAQEAFAKIAADAEAQGKSVTWAAEQFPMFQKALQGTANQLEVTNLSSKEYAEWMRGELPDAVSTAVEANNENAQGLAGVEGAAEGVNSSLTEMFDNLLALGVVQQSEMEAMAGYEEALDAVDAAVAENGRTLDITTAAGRRNQDILFGIADAGRNAIEMMAENEASQEELRGQLKTTYDDLVDTARAFGKNADEADDMAREILGIPPEVSVESWMDDAARKEAEKTDKAVDDINKDVQINVHFNVNDGPIRNMPENLLNPNRNRSNRPGSLNRWNPYNNHDGNILTPMAAGGFTGAEMVNPNTWRVVGDRMDVDEAYIPLDGSPRSIAILMETIKRMPGFGGAMADGGVTGSTGGTTSGSESNAGGIPVPDTTPITDAWQAMFDAMLTTTIEGWAAQVAQQVLAQSTLLTGAQTHLAAQTALLRADYAKQLTMQQGHNATQLTLAQGQWAAMNASILAALNIQHQQVQTGFTTQHATMAQILGLMGQTVATRWSDMSASQSSHLGFMQSNAATGFNAIRTGGEDQMSALSRAVARELGELPPETRSAMEDTASVLNKFADAVNEAFGEIGVTVPHVPAFREGGPVNGPGTGTSDSILARVSNGEFIMPADRTASYYPILEAMRSGDYPAYAAGGMVDLENAAKWLQAQNVRISEFGYWGQRVGGHAPNSYHYRPPGQAFDANYGPGGQNAIETAKFNQLVPMINSMWPSLRTLWGVAGHLNHLHVDTGGTGGAGGALGGLLGALEGGMPADLGDAYAQAAKKVGNDLVKKFSGDLPENPLAGGIGSGVMSQAVEGLIKQARDFGDSFMEGSGEAGGVERWRSTVMAALQRAGLPVTDAYIEAWLRQIMSESGGNPGIVQGVHDVNSGGNEAVGLVQVIPSTFAAFRDPSLPNDRRNPLANLVAGMNWAKFKYGIDHLDVIGHGHGYANGTMSAQRGFALVGEDGPEMLWFNGGEKVSNAATTKATLANDRVYHDNSGARALDATALGAAFAKEAHKQSVNSHDMAAALDGVRLTLVVGNTQMEAYVKKQVGQVAVGANRSH